jgi:hypothetical protein
VRAAIAVALLLSFTAAAADPAPADKPVHVELLPAGTVLDASQACMSPADAVNFDEGLRTCQNEREGLKQEISSGTKGETLKWALIASAIGFALGAVAGGAAVCAAAGCLKKGP